jgi:diguanylate cyclase (GGDEF)-like protein
VEHRAELSAGARTRNVPRLRSWTGSGRTRALAAGLRDGCADWWATPWCVRLLSGATICLASLLTVANVRGLLQPEAIGTFAVLLTGGAINVELGRRAEGGRLCGNRLSKGLSAWPFAAALLLPMGLAGLIAAGLYAHCRARGMQVTFWKWIGSWASVSLAGAATSVLLVISSGGTLPAGGSGVALGLVLLAASLFLSVEAGLLLAITRLNAREDLAYHNGLRRPGFFVNEFAVLAAGATAAILCRYWPGFLLLALPGYVQLQRAVLYQDLWDQARHDSKTGLLNSQAWEALADAQLELSRCSGRPLALLIMDLDHFKLVNDTHGHLTGDRVLVRVSDVLRELVRDCDLIGRFGGEEFCILLPGATMVQALSAAERIRVNLSELRFAESSLRITASIGLVIFDPPTPGTGVSDLIAAADRALYEAKQAGRNTVRASAVPEARLAA